MLDGTVVIENPKAMSEEHKQAIRDGWARRRERLALGKRRKRWSYRSRLNQSKRMREF